MFEFSVGVVYSRNKIITKDEGQERLLTRCVFAFLYY